MLLFNAPRFSVYLFGFIIPLRHYFLPQSQPLAKFFPSWFVGWFVWEIPLNSQNVGFAVPLGTGCRENWTHCDQGIWFPPSPPFWKFELPTMSGNNEHHEEWRASSAEFWILVVDLSFCTQQLNWIKSLFVRLCATNHVQARLQQSPQDEKIVLDLISLPAPTVLLRTQGNWFSSLASKERNFSRLISPRTEQSQLITRNNPLVKAELQGGLKTWGFSFQSQTSGAGIRSRECVWRQMRCRWGCLDVIQFRCFVFCLLCLPVEFIQSTLSASICCLFLVYSFCFSKNAVFSASPGLQQWFFLDQS